MIYSKDVEEMCTVRKGVDHGPAPIPEEGRWVKSKEIKDISGLTHGIGWCAPQQGACKLTLNVKEGIIQEALVETLGCSGMTHSAAMAGEILVGKTILEALNTDLVCDAINTAMRELFLQIVYGRSQSAFSDGGLEIGAGMDDLGKGLCSQVGTSYSTRLKGPRYLQMAEGYITKLALDKNNEQQRNELYKRLKLGNFIVLTSQGIPFLHAGQEYGRSKPALYESCENTGAFVRNSYNAPDLINAFKWNRTKEQNELCEYTKSLLKFRNSTGIFKLGSLEEIEKCVHFQEQLSENQLLVYCINQKNRRWFVAVNVSKEKQSLALAIKRPQVYADINGASVHKIEKPEGIVFQDNSVELAPLSAFIFQ